MKTVFCVNIRAILCIIALLCAAAVPQVSAMEFGEFRALFPKHKLYANDKCIAFRLSGKPCVALVNDENNISYILVLATDGEKPTEEDAKAAEPVASSLAEFLSKKDSARAQAKQNTAKATVTEFVDRRTGYVVAMPYSGKTERDSLASKSPATVLRNIMSEQNARFGSFDGSDLVISNPVARIEKLSFSLVSANVHCFKITPTHLARKEEERVASAAMKLLGDRVASSMISEEDTPSDLDTPKEAKRKTGAAKCHATGFIMAGKDGSTNINTAVVTYSRSCYYGAVRDLRLLIQDVRRKTPRKKIEYPQESNDLP